MKNFPKNLRISECQNSFMKDFPHLSKKLASFLKP